MKTKYISMRFLGLTVIFMCLSLLMSGAQANEAPWYNGQWAHEASDLVPDPAVTFGRLDNGFRYAIIPHTFPQGRVSMMLNVQAGSLMETDNELGYAHFVEHMAFNGSKNFKAGELIPFFQKHGMSFGGDTNAHTSLAETVYKLNLADNTLESIGLGAKVLRDFADGLLFAENEVQDELGVILAEKRSRENESLRASRKKRELVFAGTRFVNDVIGTDETLKAVTSEKLRTFYDNWYRPERMMLVVVGDIQPKDIEGMAKEYFADMQGKGKAIAVADWGEAKASGLRVVYQERPRDGVTISLEVLHNRHYEPDSKKRLAASLTDSLAEFCMQQRLDRLREEQPDVWMQGIYQNWSRDPMFPLASLTAVTTRENWEKTLAALSDSLRSAVQFGFTQEEMSLALKQFEVSLQGAAQARKRMPSEGLSLAFITSANAGRVFTSEEYDLELFEDFATRVRLEEVNAALRSSFFPDNAAEAMPDGLLANNLDNKLNTQPNTQPDTMANNLTVYVTGPENFLDEKTILAAYEKAQKRPVEQKTFAGLSEFPYLSLPAPAQKLPELAEKNLTADANGPVLHTARLPNGVEVYLLHYPVEEGKVQANLLFGFGSRVYEDALSPALDMLNATLQVTGVGKLDSQESQLLFGYRDMSVQEYLSFSNSVIAGAGRSGDLELLLQAMWTQYKDPVISEKDRSLIVSNVELQQRIKEETVDGVSQSQGRQFFYGNALRFGDLSPEKARAVSLSAMQNILADSRHTPPAKIIISGDFEVEKALVMVARLFGTEHFAQDKDGLPRLAAKPQFPKEITTDMVVAKDPVAKSILRLVIQNNIDESDRKALVERNLLAAVLSDRLREQLREKMGVIYGASVGYNLLADEVNVLGYGLFTVALVTGQEHIGTVKTVVNDELRLLAEQPITQDELERIRKPMLTGWETERKKLFQWSALQQAEVVKGYPYIKWNNEYATLVQSIRPDDLIKTAGEMFKDGVQASLLIYSDGSNGSGDSGDSGDRGDRGDRGGSDGEGAQTK